MLKAVAVKAVVVRLPAVAALYKLVQAVAVRVMLQQLPVWQVALAVQQAVLLAAV